jgi:saccharopine dehydrogenase-like NADP-dependent oxidoreductase
MTNVLILGSGKIGLSIAQDLIGTGDFQVSLADENAAMLEDRALPGVTTLVCDVSDEAALAKALNGQWAVINALPYFLNQIVATAAKRQDIHYFDLSEDVKAARVVRDIADGANCLYAPQCGLAPGFISVIAHHLVGTFDEARDVRLRVGALPQFPDNALRYNLTWSTEGLINEYCNPCEVIHEGTRREVLPLEGLDQFSLDGINYEAFSTSGGIGSLCDTLHGKVHNLNYKTVRYPGHRSMIQMLARDLNLCEHRETFKELIEYGIPVTRQDVVLVFVSVTGLRAGQLSQESFVRKIYGDEEEGGRSAIQKTTSAGVVILVDLLREKKIPDKGYLRLEDVPFEDYINNRFASVYA